VKTSTSRQRSQPAPDEDEDEDDDDTGGAPAGRTVVSVELGLTKADKKTSIGGCCSAGRRYLNEYRSGPPAASLKSLAESVKTVLKATPRATPGAEAFAVVGENTVNFPTRGADGTNSTV
jgi:hypothetical protein